MLFRKVIFHWFQYIYRNIGFQKSTEFEFEFKVHRHVRMMFSACSGTLQLSTDNRAHNYPTNQIWSHKYKIYILGLHGKPYGDPTLIT